MHTDICETFGIKYPIFAFTPSEKVAAAVSRAGGLGVLGCVRFNDPEELDRTLTWQAQTPQMFRLGILREALRREGPDVTDEAGAMQAAGHAPKLVRGTLENFKLTYPMDFELADRLLRSRS
jgi:NAD(P)H-dependent flavin oxidoreductase YrpB (nitropropane dioxygenase family)